MAANLATICRQVGGFFFCARRFELNAILAEITSDHERWLRKPSSSLREIREAGLKELAAAVIAQALRDLSTPIPAEARRQERLAELSEWKKSAEDWIIGDDCEIWCELADISVNRLRDKAAELLDAEYASQR